MSMATKPGRKPLAQINYEAFVRAESKREGLSIDAYESWDELEPDERRSWVRATGAVQSADRKRQKRDG